MPSQRKQFSAAFLLLACSSLHGSTAVTPPDIEFTATPAREIVKRGDNIPVVIRLTNKSDTGSSNVKITLVSPDFLLQDSVAIPLLAPFASETRQIAVTVRDSAGFTSHHPVLVSDFEWGMNPVRHSGRSAALNLQVVHEYEDEAKGLPGGSAALLYLILPIVPAFLAYDLFDGLRRGQGLAIPKFDPAYLAPAFLLAILVEYLLVLNARRGSTFDLAEPQNLVLAMAISTIAGATWPGIRMFHQWTRMRNAFQETDDLSAYLRKALEQCPDGRAPWVEGSGPWEHSAGLLLTQPDNKPVLGARLQVSPASQDQRIATKLADCFNENGDLIDSATMLQLVTARKVSLNLLESVEQAGTSSTSPVTTRGLEGFTHGKRESKQIVERVN